MFMLRQTHEAIVEKMKKEYNEDIRACAHYHAKDLDEARQKREAMEGVIREQADEIKKLYAEIKILKNAIRQGLLSVIDARVSLTLKELQEEPEELQSPPKPGTISPPINPDWQLHS